MDVAIIGIGRLGLCFALNLESKGFNVLGMDVNQEYVKSLEQKTYTTSEPKVNEFIARAKNFTPTTDLDAALAKDVIFIVVATPSMDNGLYNSCYIENVVKEIEKRGCSSTRKYIVIQSTVTPKYTATVQARLHPLNYEVSYNPEFIAQGTVIHDQRNPDVILIGESSEEAGKLIEGIYLRLVDNSPLFYHMTPTEAEITKIAVNCFVTTKISYANMIGDLAIRTGCNPDSILNAIGGDSRIGKKYLKYGFGYGGPCFPRDNRAFGVFCEKNGVFPHIAYATDKSNQSHLLYQVDHFKNNHPVGTPVTIDGVAFKEGSTIMEESQKLKYAFELKDLGYVVTIRDSSEVVNILRRRFGATFKYETK